MRKNVLIILAVFIVLMSFCLHIAHASTSTIYGISCPEDNGKIVQRIDNRSSRNVILIQDAHSYLNEQENISEIVKYYSEKIPSLTIGVEGSEGEVSLDPFRLFPNRLLRNQVAREYFEKRLFTGTEYAAISGINDIKLFGVEDWTLFESNYRVRTAILKNGKDVCLFIQSLRDVVTHLKVPIYTNDLYLFDRDATLFEQGDLALDDFLPILYRQIKALHIEMINYPHINLVYEILNQELFFNKTQAHMEETELLGLISKYVNVKNIRKVSDLERTTFVLNSCREYHVPLASKKEFMRLHAIHTLYAQLDIVSLLEELRTIVHEVRLARAVSDEQKELIEIAQRLQSIQSLIELRATRAEAKHFLAIKDVYNIASINYFLKSKSQRYSQIMSADSRHVNVQAFLDSVCDFYSGALKRDEVIVRNLVEKFNDEGLSTALLVVGGFHTEGIVEKLCEQNLNVVVISPNGKMEFPLNNFMDKAFGPLKSVQPSSVGTIQVLRTDVRVNREFLAQSFMDDLYRKSMESLGL